MFVCKEQPKDIRVHTKRQHAYTPVYDSWQVIYKSGN